MSSIVFELLNILDLCDFGYNPFSHDIVFFAEKFSFFVLMIFMGNCQPRIYFFLNFLSNYTNYDMRTIAL